MSNLIRSIDSSISYTDRGTRIGFGIHENKKVISLLKTVAVTILHIQFQSTASQALWMQGNFNQGKWTLVGNTLWPKLPNERACFLLLYVACKI